MPRKKQEEAPVESPVESAERTPAEIYAHPRKWGVLSKSEGEQAIALLKKAGFKIYVSEFDEGFTIVKVRFGDRFIVDHQK